MTTAIEQPRAPRVKKWTKEEYLDLVDHGAFQNQRVYLFRGEIIEMAPHGHPHGYGIMKLNRYLTDSYPEPYEVRIQLSFITPGRSIPEPDSAVCNEQDAQRKPHPSHADLIVEVSESSLRTDRAKAEEYAAAGVPEYWIINTDDRQIEVYQRPAQDPSAAMGWRYAETRVVKSGESLAPAGRPEAIVPVDYFLAS